MQPTANAFRLIPSFGPRRRRANKGLDLNAKYDVFRANFHPISCHNSSQSVTTFDIPLWPYEDRFLRSFLCAKCEAMSLYLSTEIGCFFRANSVSLLCTTLCMRKKKTIKKTTYILIIFIIFLTKWLLHSNE